MRYTMKRYQQTVLSTTRKKNTQHMKQFTLQFMVTSDITPMAMATAMK